MTELVERPVFATPPTAEVVQAFRRHVATTGQPETYPDVSTTRPPKDGELVVLHHPIDIERGKRPNGDMAPCPICSPATEKYLGGGTLIWCEATSAIYAIGPRCSAALWEDGRLDRAVNVFRQTERDRANAAALLGRIQAIPAHLSWISYHKTLAEKVERHQREFGRTAPKLRAALSRALRAGSAERAGIKGLPFLHGAWRLGHDLHDAEQILNGFATAVGADAGTFVANLAPSVVTARLAAIKGAIAKLSRSADKLTDAAAFLTPNNLELVALWSKTPAAPVVFTVARTGSTVDIRSGEERWLGAVGVLPPSPLP